MLKAYQRLFVLQKPRKEKAEGREEGRAAWGPGEVERKKNRRHSTQGRPW